MNWRLVIGELLRHHPQAVVRRMTLRQAAAVMEAIRAERQEKFEALASLLGAAFGGTG